MNITLRNGGSGKRLRTKLVTAAAAFTLSGAAFLAPIVAVADHTTAHTIEQLTQQIEILKAQLTALSGTPPAPGAAPGAAKCAFTRSLSQGVRGDDVMCLQQYLNDSGNQVAASGPGSPGSETTFYGSLTRAAVAKWQAANGVSPAVGYFGPISQAKYNAVVVVAPPPPPPGVTPPPPPGTPPPPAAIGTGLTVAGVVEQPPASLAVENAARVPFTKVVLTASADGDVTVNSITVERQGLMDDSAIDSVILIDDQNEQIGLTRTLNALHQAALNEKFTVKAGTSRIMTIGANMAADLDQEAGQVGKLAVIAIDAGTSQVNGTLPIAGNGMTINGTLAIGSLASPARGVLDPGAARTALEVGTTKFYTSGVRWTVGSAEPVMLEQIRWNQAGSAASGDIKNVMVTVKDKDYATTLSSDGKFYVAKFDPGIEFDKGAVLDMGVKLDTESGSNRTLDFDILRRTDVVAKGKTFGYYVLPANGSSDPTDDSGNFANNEPYYDAFEHTISKGSLRVEKSNVVPAGNVAVDISNVALGAFALDTKGEQVQISSFKLTFSIPGEDGTQIDNVAIVDENGAIVAGPKDAGSDETVTLTDTWTAPVGLHVYKITGKLTTDFEDADTITASTTPSSDITARGLTTGLSVTASPTSAVSSNQLTVRRAALKVSLSETPSAQNVVRGVNAFLFAKVVYDAGASGEDLRISKQELTITPAGGGDSDELNSCQIFDGAVALNTGSNVVNPGSDATAVNTAEEEAFAFDTHLIVPKGTIKTVEVKCNISTAFAADGTVRIGLISPDSDTTVVGKDTGTTVTEGLTANTGPIMTVRSAGSFTITKDTSSPSERYSVAGKTDVEAGVFKLESNYESVRLTKFGLVLATSTSDNVLSGASTSDVTKITLWDGATKVGEAVFTADDQTSTSSLPCSGCADFIIPKDSSKLLSVKVDLVKPLSTDSGSTLGKSGATGADSGHLVRLNWDGFRTLATEGLGQESGTTLNSTQQSHTNVAGIRLVKVYPTLERLAVPTNTLSSNSTFVLYRFKVTAPAEGAIGLFKFTFKVSSQVPMSATTSLFKVYAYNDSGFSSAAYAANPINANDIDCVGSSSLEVTANDSCSSNLDDTTAAAVGMHKFTNLSASTSRVHVLFDPSTNNAAAPNAEAINVPAGASRYFELQANVSATTTDSLSVSLLGDTQFRGGIQGADGAIGTGLQRLIGIQHQPDTLNVAEVIATSSNFVWSPNTTSTSATTTNDWLTGFLVPGLPSTEMGAQTFTK